MGKLILILLALFGAALYFPQTRPYIVDTLGPMLTPVLEWSTKGEMRKIVRDLETRGRQGNELPAPGAPFLSWAEDQYLSDDAAVDAWGNPYQLGIGRRGFTVTSWGADRELGTSDDIVMSGELEEARRR